MKQVTALPKFSGIESTSTALLRLQSRMSGVVESEQIRIKAVNMWFSEHGFQARAIV